MDNEKNQTLKHHYKLEKRDIKADIYFIDKIEIEQEELSKGIEITWLADDTDFEIWFPHHRNPIVKFLFFLKLPIHSRRRRATRKIRRNLKPGTYYYSIFCKENSTMARGNSSPQMIVRR